MGFISNCRRCMICIVHSHQTHHKPSDNQNRNHSKYYSNRYDFIDMKKHNQQFSQNLTIIFFYNISKIIYIKKKYICSYFCDNPHAIKNISSRAYRLKCCFKVFTLPSHTNGSPRKSQAGVKSTWHRYRQTS